MPWHVAKSSECPDSKPWAVIKDSDSSVVACHASEESANDQLAALYASEEERMAEDATVTVKLTVRDLWERFKSMVELAMTAQEVAEAEGCPSLQEVAEGLERAYSTGQLQEMLWIALDKMEQWAFPLDIYIDSDQVYAILVMDGKLYQVPLSLDGGDLLLGEWIEVETVHQPVGRTMIQRQADGRWRWFSVSATAVLNRVGEIDSRELFDSFVAQVVESGEYPARDFYHGGETFRTGQADFLARDGNVLITSGLYDDSPLGELEVQARLKEPDYWGDSIAFLPTAAPEMAEVAEGVKIPVYNAGIMRFISTLPEGEAASLFTTGEVQQEVERMLTGRAFEAFVKLHDGDEEAARAWLEENADETNRAIDEAGMVTRDAEPEAEGNQETEEQEESQLEDLAAEAKQRHLDQVLEDTAPEAETQEREGDPEPAEFVLDEAAIGAITDAVLASGAFTAMQEQLAAFGEQLDGAGERSKETQGELESQITGLTERLVDLERDEDEKQREWQADLPRKRQVHVTHRPREANDPNRQEGVQESLADVAAATLANVPEH